MSALVWPILAVMFVIIVIVSRVRKRSAGRRAGINVGSAASGTIYDWLNRDKRNAIEIIVEEKAEARDPETADDIVKEPDLK
jgi:hypothetical protein